MLDPFAGMSEYGNVNHKENVALLLLTSAHLSLSQIIVFVLLIHGIKEVAI